MAVKYIATLGPNGWVTDGRTMLDMVTSWLYASDKSQSHFFNGSISSIAALIEQHTGKLDNARPALQEMLTNYYLRFFDEVSVEVSIVGVEFPDSHLRGELMIRASMLDHAGKVLQLHEIMTNKGSTTRTILDYNP